LGLAVKCQLTAALARLRERRDCEAVGEGFAGFVPRKQPLTPGFAVPSRLGLAANVPIFSAPLLRVPVLFNPAQPVAGAPLGEGCYQLRSLCESECANSKGGASARLPAIVLIVGLLFATSAFSAGGAVELTRKGDHVDVLIDGEPFTTYYFSSDVAKPYFQPLRTAQGTILTRDFPIGNAIPPEHLKDRSLEPHQRAMFFGHGNIDGIDFWGEAVFPQYSDDTVFGRAAFRKLEEIRGGAESGALRAAFGLSGPEGRVIADEIQSFVFAGDQSTRWIDCEITLVANHGSDVTLGDTKEGTFGIRLANELNSPPGHMVNSEGAEGEKAIWGKRADWVDYDGTVGKEELGIAIFDSPRSFRHPTYWHARGYGLLAANPFGWREFYNDAEKDGSWTISQGKGLKFRYRVFIHHGDYRQAKVAEAYRQYAAHER